MRILLLLFVMAVSGWSATGDIVSVSVDTSGWFIHVEIEDLDTGADYDFGTFTSAAKVTLNIISPSFDTVGDSTTASRVVWGTNYKRKIYPGSTDRLGVPDEEISGSNVIVRIALNEPICTQEISVTASFLAGFYGASNGATDVPVTNNSKLSYADAKVIANWSSYSRKQIGFDEVNFRLDTTETFKLYCQAYQYFGKQKRPVKVVRFIATDQSGNADTQYVYNLTLDTSSINAVKIQDFVATMDATNLTQGDSIVCNFQAFPWYGTDSSVIRTNDGVNEIGSPLYSPVVNFNDKNHTYGNVVAVVDPVNGDNATAAVVPFASFDAETPPNPYLTIAAASNAIIAYNNTNYGHNDNGGGNILLKAGNYQWAGATATRTSPKCFCSVRPFPGVTRDQIVFQTQSGATIGNAVFIKDVTWNFTGALAIGNTNYLVTYNNDINHDVGSGSFAYTANSIWWIIGGKVRKLPQGLKNPTGYNVGVLTRGVEIAVATGTNVIAAAFMFTGVKLTSGHVTIQEDYLGNYYIANPGIVSFFKLHSQYNGALIQPLENSIGGSNFAIVQGVVETYGSTSISANFTVMNHTENPALYKNVLIWHVTVVGQRANVFYNDYRLIGQGPSLIEFGSIKNSIFDDMNSVTDYDLHGGDPSADKVGNLSIIHGCGYSGNLFCERTGAAGDYVPKYCGIKSVVGIPSAINPLYVSDKSMVGDQSGFGDYHLQSSSPAIGISYEQLLPYDLDGTARYSGGAAGAYEYGTPPQSTKPKSLILDIQNAIRGILRGIRRGVWR